MPRLLLALCCALSLSAVLAAPASAAKADAVVRTLAALEAQGRLAPEDRQAKEALYRALRTEGRRAAPGTTRTALLGAADTALSLARRRMLGGRVVPVWLNLQRTYDWFVTDRRAAPASGTRTTFPGSRVQFQFVPTAGWQFHPLANFGHLNALAGNPKVARRRIVAFAEELLALGVVRRGALAWEYLFPWGGARPGWVSGMASGTALSALARVASRTGEPRYLEAADQSLVLFERAAPWGVRAPVDGAHYLLYSDDPDLLVGNGFAQALIGLLEYAQLTASARAQALFDEGERTLRASLAGYDTGAWSLYALDGAESNLHYHRLFADFLLRLCERLGAAGTVYCDAERRFREYEVQPVALGTIRMARRGARAWTLRVPVSKVSTVTVTLRRGEQVISSRILAGRRGTLRTQVVRPRRPGVYGVEVTARSLTGVVSTATREVTVTPRKRKSPTPSS